MLPRCTQTINAELGWQVLFLEAYIVRNWWGRYGAHLSVLHYHTSIQSSVNATATDEGLPNRTTVAFHRFIGHSTTAFDTLASNVHLFRALQRSQSRHPISVTVCWKEHGAVGSLFSVDVSKFARESALFLANVSAFTRVVSADFSHSILKQSLVVLACTVNFHGNLIAPFEKNSSAASIFELKTSFLSNLNLNTSRLEDQNRKMQMPSSPCRVYRMPNILAPKTGGKNADILTWSTALITIFEKNELSL